MKVASGILGLALALGAGAACAADAPPGAAACSGCHAVNPSAETPVPKITGRKAEETVALMAEFRSGTKPSTVMGRVARGFTDEEMRPIAAWLASQK